MTDYISRQAAIDAIKENVWDKLIVNDVFDVLKDLPAAHVREVVLCKDCIAYEPEEPPAGWCHTWGDVTLEESFCSFAERRCDKHGDL